VKCRWIKEACPLKEKREDHDASEKIIKEPRETFLSHSGL
jgi:hypothetical protein